VIEIKLGNFHRASLRAYFLVHLELNLSYFSNIEYNNERTFSRVVIGPNWSLRMIITPIFLQGV